MLESKSVNHGLALVSDESKVLGLSVSNGKHTAFKPGTFIPKADAQSPPELSFPSASQTTTYLAVGLDLDAPFPSFGVLGPVLHWIQPGYKASADGKLASADPFIANYIGPAPPPPSGPHRYAFFLFEQPDGFDASRWAPPGGKEFSTASRVRYDFDKFAKEAGLGPALAVNWFNSN